MWANGAVCAVWCGHTPRALQHRGGGIVWCGGGARPGGGIARGCASGRLPGAPKDASVTVEAIAFASSDDDVPRVSCLSELGSRR